MRQGVRLEVLGRIWVRCCLWPGTLCVCCLNCMSISERSLACLYVYMNICTVHHLYQPTSWNAKSPDLQFALADNQRGLQAVSQGLAPDDTGGTRLRFLLFGLRRLASHALALCTYLGNTEPIARKDPSREPSLLQFWMNSGSPCSSPHPEPPPTLSLNQAPKQPQQELCCCCAGGKDSKEPSGKEAPNGASQRRQESLAWGFRKKADGRRVPVKVGLGVINVYGFRANNAVQTVLLLLLQPDHTRGEGLLPLVYLFYHGDDGHP